MYLYFVHASHASSKHQCRRASHIHILISTPPRFLFNTAIFAVAFTSLIKLERILNKKKTV